jgi:hypothetical protein
MLHPNDNHAPPRDFYPNLGTGEITFLLKAFATTILSFYPSSFFYPVFDFICCFLIVTLIQSAMYI